MKANLRTCKTLLLITILFFVLISVSARASTINFFLDESGKVWDVLLDFNEIGTLDPSTWAVVELGKNKKADGGLKEFKLKAKKIETEMLRYNWEGSLKSFLGDYFEKEVSLTNANSESSTPSPNPIPATVWIFGTGLMTLIMIRRKFRSPIS